MIVCVFIVMGLSVTLINYLQSRTIEMFSAFTENGEIDEQAHGELHKDCDHINDNGYHRTCGHGHDEAGAAIAAELGDELVYQIGDAGSFLKEDGTVIAYLNNDGELADPK